MDRFSNVKTVAPGGPGSQLFPSGTQQQRSPLVSRLVRCGASQGDGDRHPHAARHETGESLAIINRRLTLHLCTSAPLQVLVSRGPRAWAIAAADDVAAAAAPPSCAR
ncbi:hypothetical protein G7Z17_g11836 [Cylindrodendrum hubeiense]|uniref:Uncharacterized protein n=1 Tax=Cylindrodendrum hubeiense TaxID=595255 RepID=A0A9P5H090_9HYPO|nr:hypothetical protein G7Z17_g11836 [Cylindrodendrum hubeiense]